MPRRKSSQQSRKPPDMIKEVAFVGYPISDVARARALPGVIAIYTAADLGDYWRPGPLLVPPPPVAGAVFRVAVGWTETAVIGLA